MTDGGVTMVAKSEYHRLSVYRRAWWSGWAFGAIAAAIAIYLCSLIQAEAALRVSLVDFQTKQLTEQLRMVGLLSAQNETASLLTTWGKYVIERTDQASYNLHNPSVPVPVSAATVHR